MREAATAVLIVLILTVATLAVSIVTVRAVRTARRRKLAALAEGPRRALLAFIADNGEEGADQLVAIPEDAWSAVEAAAVGLLGKVKGDAHRALVDVFRRRGVALRARRHLRHRSAVRRARAAQVLGDLGAREAITDLGDLLDDPHNDVRIVAVRALGRIGEPAAAWRLIASLDRPHPPPSLLVADALVRLGPEAEVTLSAALDHSLARVRTVCLDALSLLGATGTASRVARVLRTDPSLEVRIAAAHTLGKLSARVAVTPLLVTLASSLPTPLRAAAARALGELGAATAVPHLESLLADEQYHVAHEAAHALRRLGGPGLAALRRAALVATNPHDPTGAGAHAREALAMAAVNAPTADESPVPTLAVVG